MRAHVDHSHHHVLHDAVQASIHHIAVTPRLVRGSSVSSQWKHAANAVKPKQLPDAVMARRILVPAAATSPSAAAAAGEASSGLTQLIADVLNEERQLQGSAGDNDLLRAIDRLGVGVTTTVTRTWEGSDALLEVSGIWEKCDEARRFAMLSVYHERVWVMNHQLSQLFNLLVRHRPGVMPAADITRVTDSITRNSMTGAMSQLGLAELLQLSAAFLQGSTILSAIEDAAEDTWQQAREQQAPHQARDPGKLHSMQAQLVYMCAAWRYQACLSMLHLQYPREVAYVGQAVKRLQDQKQGGRQSQPTRSLWVASTNKTSSKQAGTDNSSNEGQQHPELSTLAESGPATFMQGLSESTGHFVVGQLAAFTREGLTGPQCGRIGWVRFGRGSGYQSASHRPGDQSLSQSIASGSPVWGNETARKLFEAGFSRAALPRHQGLGGSAGFGADVINEFLAVYHAGQEKKKEGRNSKVHAHGLALSYEAALRLRLMNELCQFADTHPDMVAGTPLKPTCSHNTRIQSVSKDHVHTSVRITVEGQELQWMREQARTRRHKFLTNWAPYIGNPFAGKPEWEYNLQGPLTWNRLVHLPDSIQSTVITLLWGQTPPSATTTTSSADSSSATNASQQPTTLQQGSQEASQARQKLRLALPLSDMQAFMAALLDILPAATVLNAGDKAARLPVVSNDRQGSRNEPLPSLHRTIGGKWIGPVSLQIRYNPFRNANAADSVLHGSVPVADSSNYSSQSLQDTTSIQSQQLSDYEVQWLPTLQLDNQLSSGTHVQKTENGYYQARLANTHISSLINIHEDVSSRLPSVLPVHAPPSVLLVTPSHTTSHKSGWKQSLTRWLVAAVGMTAVALCIPAHLASRLLSPSSHTSIASGQCTSTPASSTMQAMPMEATTAKQEAAVAPGQHAAQKQPLRQSAGLQPATNSMDTETLQHLCDSIKAKVNKRIWLPVTSLKDTAEGSNAQGIATAAQQTPKPLHLRYQVVVSRSGQVLGCMPCDQQSATWYAHVPLSTLIRDKGAQQRQDRFLESSNPAAVSPQLPDKVPRLTASATYTPLPVAAEGVGDVAVLMLQLAQLPDTVTEMKSGRTTIECAVLEATVTPWTNMDSISTWAAHKADVLSRGTKRQSGSQSISTFQGDTLQPTSVAAATDNDESAVTSIAEHPPQADGVSINVSGGEAGLSQLERVIQTAIQQLAAQAQIDTKQADDTQPRQ